MSKIIEALKAHNKEMGEGDISKPKEVQVEKTGREFTQEQLADIYFSATGKPKSLEAPVVIKVVERPRAASLIPWIITSIAFLITALSLFSTKRIFVDIKVVDDKTPYLVSSSENSPANQNTASSQKEDTQGNQIPLQATVFEGAADLKSSQDKNGLTLVNSSVAPFARATLRFDSPVNLSGGKIIFYAKGMRGGENLAFALKDKENIQAFHKGKIYPVPNHLTTDWQKVEITLVDTAKEFDPKNVTMLRFEFGSKDTDNKPGDTIFIKDLRWML